MIPQFPEFKKIEISDKPSIDQFTKDFPPYSDFCFVALYCWDVENKRKISMLHDNLVVRSTCDLTGREFVSFLGANQVTETVNILLKYCRKIGHKAVLRMIPQETTNYCSTPSFVTIESDKDNFDYIYSISDLSSYADPKYSQIRYKCNRFLREYEGRINVRLFEIADEDNKNHLSSLWKEWCGVKETYSENERIALNRLISNASHFNLVNMMVFIDGHPVGFTINKIVSNDYAINFFSKVSYKYRGLNPFLMRETSRLLMEKGCKYLNFEEDLGLPGLRRAKESYYPYQFLRKYSIKQKSLFKRISDMVYSG